MTATAADPLADLTTRPVRRFGPADYAVLFALAAATLLVYVQTRRFDFIYYDDQAYVANNAYVRQGLTAAGVRYAFTSTIVNNWHPLTVLVELALSSLFGPSAATFHVANAVLHAAAVGLLFAFLRAATGRAGAAAAVAALWGLHPLRVESVAWVAELKDELSSVTWAGCLLAYAVYARRRTPGRYAAVAALVALALMAKPVTVTLPFVLLLIDYWPLNRDRPAGQGAGRWWTARVLEKLPLVALAAVTLYIAVRSQGAAAALVRVPLADRASNALASTAIYLRQLVWPAGLGLFYPHPWYLGRTVPLPVTIGAGLLLVGLTVAVLVAGRRRRYLPVGWFWFLGTLLPVIGLLQSGAQGHADRFTLLPAMGLTIAVVWLVAEGAAARPGRRWAGPVAGLAAAAALTTCTLRLLPSWQNANTIWSRADAAIPDNYVARSARATLALKAGDPDGAERLGRQAVAMAPAAAAGGHTALAMALATKGEPTAAFDEFVAALKIEPSAPLLRYQVGAFLAQTHRDEAAREQLERAVKLDPTFNLARNALAAVLARQGRPAEAADQYRTILSIAPGDAGAAGNLADLLRPTDAAAARPLYAAALAGGQRNPEWETELAWLTAVDATATVAQLAPLADTAKDACDRTGDREPFPLYAYSLVLARLGRYDDAIAAATTALDRAKQTGPPTLAAAIDKRLAAYRQGRPAATP